MSEEITKHIAALSAEQRVLFIKQLQQAGIDFTELPIQKMPPEDGHMGVPLSFGQERIWFLEQLQPNTPTFNIPIALKLEGRLDVVALQKSFQALVERHEVLRAQFFVNENGRPSQTFPTMSLRLVQIDCTEKPEPDVVHLAQEEAQRPFDLATDPLLRVHLFALNETEHILTIVIHHIVFDGWSVGVLQYELSQFYTQFYQGTPSKLSLLPLDYKDFAFWQQQVLQTKRFQSQLTYWKEKLGGELPILSLPSDHVPTDTPEKVVKHPFTIPADVAHTLRQLSKQENATLFMVALTAFYILLHRYTGQEDIIIGTPIAGRHRMETEKLIGFFLNTLALRQTVNGRLTVRQLIKQVQATTVEAYENQDLPFEVLIKEVQPERDLRLQPIFQTLLVLHNNPMPHIPLDESVQVKRLDINSGAVAYNITLDMTDTGTVINGVCEYNTRLFLPETIQRIVSHLQQLLRSMGAQPDTPIANVQLLPHHEQTQLTEWATAHYQPSTEQPYLPTKLAQQAEATPQAIAIIEGDRSLTYAQLNERANRLAHYLITQGIGAEKVVAVHVPRGIDMAVAFWAVLKTGGAYLPVDPEYPTARREFMMADAGVSFILTQQKWLAILPPTEAPILCLDTEWDTVRPYGATNPRPAIDGAHLAYMIYTSGSTGRPKGVMVTHDSLRSYLSGILADLALDATDRFFHFASISFDASTEELYPPWMVGATVVARSAVTPSPTEFMTLINTYQLTVLSLPTAFWHEWVYEMELLGWRIPESVRLVLVNAEEPTPEKFATWLKVGGDAVRWMNTYGPTEITVTATIYEPKTAVEKHHPWQRLPMGYSLHNLRPYVLDRYMNMAPIGMPGELYIAGDGITRGYLGRPQRTAVTYIPNPFGKNKGERLYKTGDYVRYLADGNMEFLQRIDAQVKIRGFRVELGEIETTINQINGVRNVVVLAHAFPNGERFLAAYIVATQRLAISEIKLTLAEQLPEYMIPTFMTFMDKLPLNPNGKVDKRALPVPSYTETMAHDKYIPPRNQIEYQLQQIWEQLMQVKPIGVRHNFFTVGGNSLIAVRLLAIVERTFAQKIPLDAFLQVGTIEHLGRLIRRGVSWQTRRALVTLKGTGEERPFFCVHGAGGHITRFIALTPYIDQTIPFYALQTVALEDTTAPLMTSIKEIAAQYLEEIKTVQATGPYRLGGWSMGGFVAHEIACQLQAQGETVEHLLMIDSRAPTTPDEREALTRDELTLVSVAFGLTPDQLAYLENMLDGIPKEQHLDTLFEFAKEEGFFPLDVDETRARRFVEVHRQNLLAMWNHTPHVFDGKITFFRAKERLQLPEETIDQRPTLANKLKRRLKDVNYLIRSKAIGWDTFATQGVESFVLSGDHFTILMEPHVSQVGEAINEQLLKDEI